MNIKELSSPQYINESMGLYGFKLDNVYLAGMPIPQDDFLWQKLRDFGISFILCLTHQQAPYDPTPVKLLDAKELDDQNHGLGPDDPEAEEKLIRDLAAQVCSKLEQGESVVIHCVGGTGRTGTLMAAVLRNMGYSYEQVESAMLEANQLRGKGDKGWPESQWQKELIRNW